MLVHIRPTLFLWERRSVVVNELTVEPLGLRLGAKDLAVRRPYPNGCLNVICRRRGNLAVYGLMIEAPRLAAFTVTTRWAVAGEPLISHHVAYTVLDDDYDLATDDKDFWRGVRDYAGHDHDEHRMPDEPCAQPMMDLVPRVDMDPAEDVVTGGRIVERRQRFAMPTVDRARLRDYQYVRYKQGRMPQAGDAFVAVSPTVG